MAKVLWGSKTPGQANDQRDEVILANKKKVLLMYYTYSYLLLWNIFHILQTPIKFYSLFIETFLL